MTAVNEIYTYGGGEILYHIFNAVALIFGNSGVFTQMMKIAVTIGGFWAIVNIILRNNVMQGINWFMWMLLATEVFFIPKTTVFIRDPITRYERTVSNVPIGLGLVASFCSKFGHILTQEMENKFALPDAWAYHKTGMVFGSKLLSSMGKVRIVDSHFYDNMHNFINQCVVLTSMIGHKYTVEGLRQSTDIWNLVKSNAPQIIGFPYRELGSPPEILTCREGAVKLEGMWRDQVERTSKRLARVNLPDFVTGMVDGPGPASVGRGASDALLKQTFESLLTSTFTELDKIGTSAEKILQQQMMVNAILDRPKDYAVAKAMIQQRNTHGIMGALAEGLPLVKTVFEAICYGSFVFVMMLALFPGGHRVLFSYFQIILWLQLWAPLNAILNLIITVTSKSRTSDLYNGGMTLANSVGIIRINEEMCLYAMYLSMLVPMIAMAVVRGGVSSFVSLSSQISGGQQMAAAGVAGEVTSGNISLGNISQRVRSYENTTMFQGSTSPTSNAGQHQDTLPDGATRTTNADGSVVYRSAVSSLATNLRVSDHISSQATENIAQEKSAIATRSKELSSAESTAVNQLASFIERASLAKSSGENYGTSDSAASTRSIQNAIDCSKSVQSKFGVNSRQAAIITASASLGVKVSGVNLGAEVQGSTDADRTQSFSEAEDYVKKSGYSENIDSVSRATKDVHFSENQSEDKSLTENITASVDKVKSIREANSVSEQNIHKYGNALSYVKSHGMTIDQTYNQRFLDWLSTRQEHGRAIGSNTARKMIDRWAPDAQTYFKTFMQQEMNQIMNASEMQAGREKVDSFYEKNSVGTLDTENHLKQVHDKAATHGVTKNVVKNEHLKETVNTRLDDAKKQSDERQAENTQKMADKQRKIDEKYSKNPMVTAVRNVGNTDKDH